MKRPLLLTLSFLVFLSIMACGSGNGTGSTSAPAGAIQAIEASSHIGSYSTVCGEVKSPTYSASSSGQPTFLNLGRAFPDQYFTVVIWGRDRDSFSSPPESSYRNHTICATGLIESYQGVPQIQATGPSQIKVID